MCPKDDIELEDLDKQAPDRLVYERYLVGFLHHTCFATRPKKDEHGNEILRFSKLEHGVKPLFRDDELKVKMKKNLTLDLFPKGS